MSLLDKKKQVEKNKDVNIKQIQTVLVPNPMGSLQLMIFGLGEDNFVYAWDSKKEIWVVPS